MTALVRAYPRSVGATFVATVSLMRDTDCPELPGLGWGSGPEAVVVGRGAARGTGTTLRWSVAPFPFLWYLSGEVGGSPVLPLTIYGLSLNPPTASPGGGPGCGWWGVEGLGLVGFGGFRGCGGCGLVG